MTNGATLRCLSIPSFLHPPLPLPLLDFIRVLVAIASVVKKKKNKKLPGRITPSSISSSFRSRIGQFYETLHSARRDAPLIPRSRIIPLFLSCTLFPLPYFFSVNKKIFREISYKLQPKYSTGPPIPAVSSTGTLNLDRYKGKTHSRIGRQKKRRDTL